MPLRKGPGAKISLQFRRGITKPLGKRTTLTSLLLCISSNMMITFQTLIPLILRTSQLFWLASNYHAEDVWTTKQAVQWFFWSHRAKTSSGHIDTVLSGSRLMFSNHTILPHSGHFQDPSGVPETTWEYSRASKPLTIVWGFEHWQSCPNGIGRTQRLLLYGH